MYYLEGIYIKQRPTPKREPYDPRTCSTPHQGLRRLSRGGRSLLFLGGGRLSLRSFVMTLAGSFGGRLSLSLFCAKAPAETTPSIAITKISRISLIIFSLSPHARLRAWEGERVAPTTRQQERCQMLFSEESNNRRPNSHGFALIRTLSYNHNLVQNAPL
jgi:hypothetical protein